MHSSNSTARANNVSPQGTERCDHFTGQCICKPGVEVRTKEECKYVKTGNPTNICRDAIAIGAKPIIGVLPAELAALPVSAQMPVNTANATRLYSFLPLFVLFVCLLSSTMIHRQRANAFARTVSEDRSARTVSMDIGTSAPMDVSSVLVTLIMLSGEAVTRRLASAHVCPMWRGSTATVAQRITSSFRTSGGQDPSCQLGRSPLNMLTVASLVSPALLT